MEKENELYMDYKNKNSQNVDYTTYKVYIKNYLDDNIFKSDEDRINWLKSAECNIKDFDYDLPHVVGLISVGALANHVLTITKNCDTVLFTISSFVLIIAFFIGTIVYLVNLLYGHVLKKYMRMKVITDLISYYTTIESTK